MFAKRRENKSTQQRNFFRSINPLSNSPQSIQRATPIKEYKRTNYDSISCSSDRFTSKKRFSLPSIKQPSKQHFFDIDARKGQIIEKILCNKNKSLTYEFSKHKRYSTQMSQRKVSKVCNLSPSSKNTIILQELRMNPVQKYFYKLDNIRLAERLLIAKPSPEINKNNHKKFYKKQNYYKSHICKNYIDGQKIKKSKQENFRKKWVD